MTTVSPIKLAVLVSGGGTTLQNLIDCIDGGRLDAKINIVIGSRSGLGGLEKAAAAKLMTYIVERANAADVAAFSKQVFGLCDDAEVDLICLGGWLSLLQIPEKWAGRVMNIHPALLPSFGGKGMFGRKVHEAAIGHGVKVSGCTVHFVDDSYDNGPIIIQRVCAVKVDDTPQTLAARLFEEEKIAYPEAISLFAQGRLRIEGRKVRISGEEDA
jgi:formyltetrahydrofolate-dependent phosphoribosylglycinamide formyltransferase